MKAKIASIVEFFKKNDFVAALAVFFLVWIFFWTMYHEGNGVLFLDDNFFLFKLSYLFRLRGWDLVKNFDWIYLWQNVQNHVRYSLSLFDVVSIPFTYSNDLIVGMKSNAIFWGAFSIGLFFLVLRKSGVRNAILFIGLLATNAYFMSRMLSGRAFVLIASLVFVEMYLAIKQKYFKLFLVFVFHIMWHEATFFMPLIIVSITEVSRYLSSYQCRWKNFIAAIGAILAGMAFYPEFPQNIINLGKTLIGIHSNLTTGIVKIEGGEVYPMDVFGILSKSEILLMILFICIVLVIFYYVFNKERDDEASELEQERTTFLYVGFLFALFSFAGVIVASGRLLDFYFSAVIFLAGIAYTKISEDGFVKVMPLMQKFVMAGFLIFFILGSTSVFIKQRQAIVTNDYYPVKFSAEWIKDKSQGKDLVFLTNWSNFPIAFFYDDKNVYTMGAEPRLLLEYNPELYWKWYNMTTYGIYCEKKSDCGAEKNQYNDKLKNVDDVQKESLQKENLHEILASIKSDFGARYILDDGTLRNVIPMEDEMIKDSFEYKSQINNTLARAFELK